MLERPSASSALPIMANHDGDDDDDDDDDADDDVQLKHSFVQTSLEILMQGQLGAVLH